MARPSSYPRELRERAVRLVAETAGEYDSEFAAIVSIAGKLGIGSPETLRKWVRRAQIDAGQRPGLTTEESEQIKALLLQPESRRMTAVGCRFNCSSRL